MEEPVPAPTNIQTIPEMFFNRTTTTPDADAIQY